MITVSTIIANLTIEAVFGYEEFPDSSSCYCTHILRINGRSCFVHSERDFGLISLPSDKEVFLDELIGGLPIRLLSVQHDEYYNRKISIVGYPGEKNPHAMYTHSGPIKMVYPNGTVHYEVDTSEGNSGSPGFLELNETVVGEISVGVETTVSVVHTHNF